MKRIEDCEFCKLFKVHFSLDLAQDNDYEIQVDFSKLPNDVKNQVSISRGDSGSENEAFEHFTELNLKTEVSKGRATKAQLGLIVFIWCFCFHLYFNSFTCT